MIRAPSASQRVYVNANASAGVLGVELLAANGNVLGASVLHGDAVRHELVLVDGSGVALDVAGRPVQLRFMVGEGVHLYSYWFDVSADIR